MKVHDAYLDIAQTSPDRLAVVDDSGHELTYQECCDSARIIASSILGRIKVGESVAVMVPRTVHSLCVYIAASLAGLSLVPLAAWAEASQTGMKREIWERNVKLSLEQGKVGLLICDSDFQENIGDLEKVSMTDILSPCEAVGERSNERFQPTVLKLLSGGSTGHPKLYEISHCMVLSELKNYGYVIRQCGETVDSRTERVLQQSPTVWPASMYGQFNIALAVGGCAVISVCKDAKNLSEVIAEKRVTIVGGTPPQLLSVSEFLSPGHSVKVMFVWGEALQKQTGKKISESSKCVLIELLIATEYWLCLFGQNSGRFRPVPDCNVSVTDPDQVGIGQLCLEGPMVMGGRMVTQDLVRLSNTELEFVGRKDFMIKIGANWFDVSEIEQRVMEHGAWIVPPITGAVVVGTNLVISIQPDVFPLDIHQYLKEVRSSINAPIELHIRVMAASLPRTVTGKLDRRAVVSMLETTKQPEHVAIDKAKRRLWREVVSQSKWAAALAAASFDFAPWVPYMYLATLYIPRSEYLPKARAYSSFSALSHHLIDFVRKQFPFGVAGLIVVLVRLRKKHKIINRIVIGWTLFGLFLALKGKRAVSWQLAFWAGAGQSIRDEGAYWLRPGKWKRLFSSIMFLCKSVPDSLIGTNLCGVDSVTPEEIDQKEKEPEAEKAEVSGERGPMSPEDEWWHKKVVDYISLSGEASACVTPKGEPVEDSSGTVEGFVDHVLRSLVGEVPLRGLSSLKITELVQALRLRVPAVSARMIMDSDTVESLRSRILDSATSTPSIITDEMKKIREVRVQFSPGQINRPCRWLIRSKQPIDRTKLREALERLQDRHPLLRSEMVDPKQLLSFLYDAGVMVCNMKRYSGNKKILNYVLNVMGKNVHAAWARLRIYPTTEQVPKYWLDTLTESGVSDYEALRRSIVTMKRDYENVWNTFQRPLMAHIFSLPEGLEFILLSVKHSVSDGNSAFPLMDELAQLYQNDETMGEISDPIPELETRFKDGILSNESNPDRTSLRTQIFYSTSLDVMGGGYYRHYVCFEAKAIKELRHVAQHGINTGFDSVLLSVFFISLMRTDKQNKETITLYCPSRDGVNESSYIGLFADWRDLTVQALPGATVLDVVLDVSDKVRRRVWEPTVSPGGPESVLLNWLAFDGKKRLADKSWEPYHVDKITQRWNRMETRDYDLNETPSGRFRSMSLEQYDENGDWWLRFDVATKLFPPEWMMRFGANVNTTFTQIINNPLVPLFENI